jgi:hypothetical protein
VKRPSSVCLVLLVLCAASDSGAQTPSVLDLFRYDPVRYFTGSASQKWVGNVSFMLTDYSDTLKLAVDSSGQALVISRVLVRTSDTTVVSRGAGLVTPEPRRQAECIGATTNGKYRSTANGSSGPSMSAGHPIPRSSPASRALSAVFRRWNWRR